MPTFGPDVLSVADELTDAYVVRDRAYGRVTELLGAESDVVVLLSPSAGSPGPAALSC